MFIGASQGCAKTRLVERVTGYTREFRTESDKPSGPTRGFMDVSRLPDMGWGTQIDLDQGVAQTYR